MKSHFLMYSPQVQLIFIREGFTFRLEMQHETELSIIWRLNMHYKDSDKEGQTKINFQLEHKELANANNNTWRLSQLEGFFTVPSFRQGILKAPGAATGQAKIVWGSALQPTKIELELRSDNRNENWPLNCTSDSANCLQAVSNLATVQTVFLNCVNVSDNTCKNECKILNFLKSVLQKTEVKLNKISAGIAPLIGRTPRCTLVMTSLFFCV